MIFPNLFGEKVWEILYNISWHWILFCIIFKILIFGEKYENLSCFLFLSFLPNLLKGLVYLIRRIDPTHGPVPPDIR